MRSGVAIRRVGIGVPDTSRAPTGWAEQGISRATRMRSGVAIRRVDRVREGGSCCCEGDHKECNSGHGHLPSIEGLCWPPTWREVAQSELCVSLRDLTGLGDGSGMCNGKGIWGADPTRLARSWQDRALRAERHSRAASAITTPAPLQAVRPIHSPTVAGRYPNAGRTAQTALGR